MNEPQKTTTEEYWKNWERIYGLSVLDEAKQRESQIIATSFNYLTNNMLKDDYPNGCPILEEK